MTDISGVVCCDSDEDGAGLGEAGLRAITKGDVGTSSWEVGWGDGIALLPLDVADQGCDLVLRSACSVFASQTVSMPPSWDVLRVRAPRGYWMFCLQTEDMAPEDLFGARCQVTTLRPRCVLTNASSANAFATRHGETSSHTKESQRRVNSACGDSLEYQLVFGGRSCSGGPVVRELDPGASVELHWQQQPAGPASFGDGEAQNVDEDTLVRMIRFRPRREPPCSWSFAVLCEDVAAGVTPVVLSQNSGSTTCGPSAPSHKIESLGRGQRMPSTSDTVVCREMWTVEVAPVRGALAVTIRPSSDFVAANRAVDARVSMRVRPLSMARSSSAEGRDCDCGDVDASSDDFALVPGEETAYGWVELGSDSQRDRAVDVLVGSGIGAFMRLHVEDVRKSQRRPIPSLRVTLVTVRVGVQSLLILEDSDDTSGGTESFPDSATVNGSRFFRIEVKLGQVGISLLESLPHPRELLYVHLSLVRVDWQKLGCDSQELKVAISDMQVDCQLPGRVDANTQDRRREKTLGLLHSEKMAVVLANCASGDRAFLNLFVRLGAASSSDWVLEHVEVMLDAVDVTIDDGWIEPLENLVRKCLSECRSRNGRGRKSLRLAHVLTTSGRPISTEYRPPLVPAVVQIEKMHIAAVRLTVWCSLGLKSVRFLPGFARTAIRVFFLGGRLTLDGVPFKLPARSLKPHRGSFADFARALASEYTVTLLRNLGTVLGKTSLLSLPKVPVISAVAYLTDSIGLAAGEAASLLSLLTLDSEYVAQQRHLRAQSCCRIHGLGDGILEAGKSLAVGVDGVFDVVRKPVEGAARHGVSGFMSGIGRGVAAGVVKPISQIGQAISDVGTGIAAHADVSAVASRRRARVRRRLPRLLYSFGGSVRPWSALDAEVLAQFGTRLSSGVEEIVPLTQHGSERTLMLLFGRRVVVAEIRAPRGVDPHPRARTNRAGGIAIGGPVIAAAAVQQIRDDHKNSTSISSSSNGSGKITAVDTISDGGSRLLLQAMKPLNTLMYGLQDIDRHLRRRRGLASATLEEPGDLAICRRARELRFAELRGVHVDDEECNVLQLEDMHGCLVTIPLFAAALGRRARDALAAGFESAVGGHTVASWDSLREAIEIQERFARRDSMPSGTMLTRQGRVAGAFRGNWGDSGHGVLEVVEVERRVIGTSAWKTPFLPTDGELSWRWVDHSGSRHSNLAPGLMRIHAVISETPPCQLDTSLFRYTSDWEVSEGPPFTGEQGWLYGIAWRASAWSPTPGRLDTLRRRLWTRSYA
eukprot:TRINITY_DN12557_c1_g2_i1.p1 TRINITY_DN12557_c1_g2~~TRINITY_DN12557_c1_g2_i1.p1  ORF type:complete len:1299 (-),score=168.54 TRINITY_DN12557_c1_g2_i1:149-3949(-)